jgi:septal ring factor EnvC (AmiA/AmiB activator)
MEHCSQHGENNNRIAVLEKRIDLVESDVRLIIKRQSTFEANGAVMENQLENITNTLNRLEKWLEKSIDEMKISISALETAGAKKYEGLKFAVAGAIITGVIGGFIAYMWSKF